MIRFPADLTAETFLAQYWQKQPLFIPNAIDGPAPALSRDELGWLATLDDVESRIVFTERTENRIRYRAESGPFDEQFLTELPDRDWTLLVHDVEKHLPEFRALFSAVPFIPDWRIDDLMISFAAPGGGVGPHKDNYDVFLVQGEGARDWHFTNEEVASDRAASDDLALLQKFEGELVAATRGDILYLPPGAPHWGTASEACLTYSIGMRAPQLSDLVEELPDDESVNPFYEDPDLSLSEIAPGYISIEAIERALRIAETKLTDVALGQTVTRTKDWLQPESASPQESADMLDLLASGASLNVHGMARVAWDNDHLYVNGATSGLTPESCDLIMQICDSRTLSGVIAPGSPAELIVRWMLQNGAFELPETL